MKPTLGPIQSDSLDLVAIDTLIPYLNQIAPQLLSTELTWLYEECGYYGRPSWISGILDLKQSHNPLHSLS